MSILKFIRFESFSFFSSGLLRAGTLQWSKLSIPLFLSFLLRFRWKDLRVGGRRNVETGMSLTNTFHCCSLVLVGVYSLLFLLHSTSGVFQIFPNCWYILSAVSLNQPTTSLSAHPSLSLKPWFWWPIPLIKSPHFFHLLTQGHMSTLFCSNSHNSSISSPPFLVQFSTWGK